MKKNHPITYEHLGWTIGVILAILVLFLAGMGFLDLFKRTEKCYNDPRTNGTIYEVRC